MIKLRDRTDEERKLPYVLNAVYKGKDIHSTWLWLLTKGETGYRWINLSCGLSRDECDDEEALKLTMKEMKCLGVLVTE